MAMPRKTSVALLKWFALFWRGVITMAPHFAIAGGRVTGYNALCLSVVDAAELF
jgi:hypothetical protein